MPTLTRAVALVLTATMLAACGTTTAEKVATTALTQLTSYERDVLAKVKAESDYYERVMDNASARINELWDNEQPFRLEQEVKDFVLDNLTTPAGQLPPRLVKFLDASMQAWASRDEGYETLLADTMKSLADRRKILDVENARIAQLRNKLEILSQARSDREMLTLAIGFVKETKDQLDQLSAEAAAASAGAKP